MSTQNQIPKKWQKVKLGEIAYITKLAGYEFTKFFNSYKQPGEIIVLRGQNLKLGKLDLTDTKTIELNVSQLLPRSQLKINNLVFSYVGTIGPVALIEEDNKYHLGPNICKISPSNQIDPKFLFQYFLSQQIRDEINKKISITAQPSLSMEKIRDFEFKIPPNIKIQQKIATILSSVDEAIHKTDQIIQETEVLKQGLMNELLTKGIGHKKFKKSKLWTIPATWTVEKLDDQIEFRNGFAFNTRSYSDHGKTVLRMSNIGTDGRLNVNSDNIKYVDEDLYNNLSDFTLRKNDLVIAMTDVTKELGIVGKTAIVDKDNTYILNQRVGRIRPKIGLDVRFLHYFTNSTYWLEPIHKKVTGSAQFNLSTHDIREAQILVPPYDEQIKIVELLDNTDSKILNENVTKERLINLKNGLMQDIFNQKVQIN